MFELIVTSSMSMELDVSDFYLSNFIFKCSTTYVLAIPKLVMILLLLLVLSRLLLNSLYFSLCLNDIFLTWSDKGCIFFDFFVKFYILVCNDLLCRLLKLIIQFSNLVK